MKKKSPTLLDIATELDVDVSTVSKALKDHPKISDATIKKVKQVAKRLNYHPNDIATALVKGQSNLIGVMVPHTDDNFFASAIRGIEETAKEAGYNIIIFQSNDSPKDEISNIEIMFRTKVDGIIASHAMMVNNFNHYQKILDQNIPLILFDRFTDSMDTNVVAIDDFKGAYKATSHLIEQGCMKIAHYAGRLKVHIYEERFRGYRQALKDYGLPFNKELVMESDMSLKHGRELTTELLNRGIKFDAIFASSDYTALGAIQVFKEHDIKVPEQVAVVGFSNEAFTSFVTPSITSVKQHSRKMGTIAAQLFLDQLTSKSKSPPQKIILTPELVVRSSSSIKDN